MGWSKEERTRQKRKKDEMEERDRGSTRRKVNGGAGLKNKERIKGNFGNQKKRGEKTKLPLGSKC